MRQLEAAQVVGDFMVKGLRILESHLTRAVEGISVTGGAMQRFGLYYTGG